MGYEKHLGDLVITADEVRALYLWPEDEESVVLLGIEEGEVFHFPAKRIRLDRSVVRKRKALKLLGLLETLADSEDDEDRGAHWAKNFLYQVG